MATTILDLQSSDIDGFHTTPTKRTRYQRGKSRRGCHECKSRRLKCDETKPGCNNCLERGTKCPGYIQPLRWSNKHERFYQRFRPLDGNATDPPTAADTSKVNSTDSSDSRSRAIHSQYVRASPAERDTLTPLLHENMVDLPNALIEFWFRRICPVWSTFDSNVNFNRRLATDTWSSSKAVFCALQAMSAAYLLETTPHLKDMLYLLTQEAISSIADGMSIMQQSSSPQVDVGLIFAVFAMGTSSHWTDMSGSGEVMLDNAEDLMHRWKMIEDATTIGTFLHAYFEQALVYWQMLPSLSRDVIRNKRLDLRRELYHQRHAVSSGLDYDSGGRGRVQIHTCLEGTRPNSWCGVSCEVIDLFGQTLVLCRDARSRHRFKGSIATTPIAYADLCDISIAKELHVELLKKDFNATLDLNELLGFSLETEDVNTPISHLIRTAEAFRLASLLQLYLTFDELQIHTSRSAVGLTSGCGSSNSRSEEITAVTVCLTSVLEQIPVQSGSKSIHPILYISAAAGLWSSPEPYFPLYASGEQVDENGRSVDAPPVTSFCTDWKTTSRSISVSQARQFFLSRLEVLQSSLPSKPIGVALKLVQAIQENHDKGLAGCGQHMHWIDVMIDTGLQTLFG